VIFTVNCILIEKTDHYELAAKIKIELKPKNILFYQQMQKIIKRFHFYINFSHYIYRVTGTELAHDWTVLSYLDRAGT